jgi:hypothetical protein
MDARADADLLTMSRRACRDLEVLHVVGYFARQVTAAYTDLGLDPRLCYFPGRAAALGTAGPGLVVSTFYVFAPWLVEAALPASWEKASPDQVVAARRDGVRSALASVLDESPVAEASEIAHEVCTGLRAPGRPLYAAHADLPWPDDDLVGLWHAATLLREHRGDGHIAVLQLAGLDPVEATVLGGLHSGTTRFLRKTRGWSEEEYADATARLRDRGLLDADGAFSDEGRAVRDRIEDDTDRLAVEAWARVGLERTMRLRELVRPLRDRVLASDLLPRSLRGPSRA